MWMLLIGGALCLATLYTRSAILNCVAFLGSQEIREPPGLFSTLIIPLCGLALGLSGLLLIASQLFYLRIMAIDNWFFLFMPGGLVYFVAAALYPAVAFFSARKTEKHRAGTIGATADSSAGSSAGSTASSRGEVDAGDKLTIPGDGVEPTSGQEVHQEV